MLPKSQVSYQCCIWLKLFWIIGYILFFIIIYQELVEQITKITHSHPSAVDGAIFQSFAVDLALRGQKEVDIGAFCDELQKRIKEREKNVTKKIKKRKLEEDKADEDNHSKYVHIHVFNCQDHIHSMFKPAKIYFIQCILEMIIVYLPVVIIVYYHVMIFKAQY